MMKKRNPASAKRLNEVFSYNPLTGDIRWKVQLSNTGKLGDLVCRGLSHGYKQVRLDGAVYKQHRVAWAIYYGEWPAGIVDHFNGDRTDNRITNLRSPENSINILNAPLRSDNKSEFKGVFWDGNRQRWRVECCNQYVGRFKSKADAVTAYTRRLREIIGTQTLPMHPLSAQLEI